MAVAEVYGTCDGKDIIFSRNSKTGRWDAIVPFDEDGEYVTEIRAKDEAGNEGYYATVLFIVDTKHLCVEMKILKVSAKAKADGLQAGSKVKTTHYRAKVMRCEICGRF